MIATLTIIRAAVIAAVIIISTRPMLTPTIIKVLCVPESMITLVALSPELIGTGEVTVSLVGVKFLISASK